MDCLCSFAILFLPQGPCLFWGFVITDFHLSLSDALKLSVNFSFLTNVCSNKKFFSEYKLHLLLNDISFSTIY